ncbi:hypothetical protein [uncultured Maribacter sp.]|uniref:hypothetical protein n=1 Tax=uncultured Maribacter sp. TaxID=431308 RepID=UPI002613A992|nr:hypothetical protein [uncultured Maribacter sp.]
MRKWLEDVRAPKMYRYLFYTMVRWAKSWNNDSPNFSSMLLMTTTFGFQSSFIVGLLGAIIDINIWGLYIVDLNPLFLLVYFFVICLISYILFYYNEKFSDTEKEFKNESIKQRRLGSIYLFIYLFISFSLLYLNYFFLRMNNVNYNYQY